MTGLSTSLLTLVLGYFIGAFPSADVVARLRGARIQEVGSGNVGAMNTARNLGWVWGFLVFALDVGKGVLAAYVGLLVGSVAETALISGLVAGVGAVWGHIWSPYIGFRGGKGLATTLGVALPIYPLGGLSGFALLIVLVLLLRRVARAGVVLALLYPFAVHLAVGLGGAAPGFLWLTTLSAALIALAVGVKHAPSLRGDEPIF